VSSTAFNAIAAGVIATLQAGSPVADLIERARPRTRPIAEQYDSAVIVRLASGDADLASIEGGRTNWETLIELELHVRGTSGQAPDVLVDPLMYEVHARLMADPSVGVAGVDLQLAGVRWGASAESDRVGDARLVYRATHQTESATLA